MIKVINETPITINGQDYNLQLIYDDTIWCEDSCDYCYFQDWSDWDGCFACCSDVHGCGASAPTYFKLADL